MPPPRRPLCLLTTDEVTRVSASISQPSRLPNQRQSRLPFAGRAIAPVSRRKGGRTSYCAIRFGWGRGTRKCFPLASPCARRAANWRLIPSERCYPCRTYRDRLPAMEGMPRGTRHRGTLRRTRPAIRLINDGGVWRLDVGRGWKARRQIDRRVTMEGARSGFNLLDVYDLAAHHGHKSQGSDFRSPCSHGDPSTRQNDRRNFPFPHPSALQRHRCRPSHR